jgi:ABC-2 type transport system ATP-binding protein
VPEAAFGQDTPVTSPASLALATRGLRKSYGKRLALDGLDLSVPTGVVYGFLGPNGAGKTTTMRLLTGLLHPDAGSIELLGQAFTRRDRKRLFEVGALVENPSFYPYLSGRRNLEVLAAAGGPVPAGRIEAMLELVGLRERARDKVSGYSLGMKQRLGIAGALLSDPKLLLLDEPANGLDPAGIVAMREMLRRLAGMGKTVFVSSHLLAEVRVLADVVGIIAAGKLVREGPLESLLGDQGIVRVRVTRADEAGARTVLERMAPTEIAAGEPDEDPWLSVHVEPKQAGAVNRALAEAGIYASGLESGTDLELLFLQLTGGGAPSSEGTFGAAGVTAGVTAEVAARTPGAPATPNGSGTAGPGSGAGTPPPAGGQA